MKSIVSIIGGLALLALTTSAFAAVPWGTAPLNVSGATPTCTYTATSLACIENMTANVTSLTLAGMTAGVQYTIVWVQDGTGGRTLTQTPITAATGGIAVPAIPSAANKFTVWVIQATSASAATIVQNYDNAALFDVYTNQVASNGTQLTTGTMQAQTALIAPGVTANNTCVCMAETLPATWQTGIILGCLTGTNTVTCEEFNPTAGSITPAAVTLNAKIFP